MIQSESVSHSENMWSYDSLWLHEVFVSLLALLTYRVHFVLACCNLNWSTLATLLEWWILCCSDHNQHLFLFRLSDVAEELRLPAASRRPHVRPAAGESHAVRRGRHAALLRHSCDGNTGRDDYRVSHHEDVCVCVDINRRWDFNWF